MPNKSDVIRSSKLAALAAREKKQFRRTQRHHFIFAALCSPFKIGGLVPSSRRLAKAMASGVNVSSPGMVIELGAGTGVVTQALLKAGISPDKLLVIERDERLYHLMSSNFPHLTVLKADAIELDSVLRVRGVTDINAIVSSLPFLSMPKEVRFAIQHHMATLIGDHGVLVQFTYGLQSPFSAAMMRKYQLQGRRIKLVLGNIPPAHVWVYKRA